MTEEADVSVFQTKYNEFIDDLLGALPEYNAQIIAAKGLDEKARLSRFQEEVKVGNTLGGADEDYKKNPGSVLPGVVIDETVWNTLSDNTQKAIWEHVRILSICCFMEAGFSEEVKPEWMEDAMNEMKTKLEGADFQNIIKKFMNFFKPSDGAEADAGAGEGGDKPGLKGLFEHGFPQIPDKFLKGSLARLAKEIVKDIKPEDLGINPEMISECEKNTSRAFEILFSVFSKNPALIQKTVQKIGKRLQQKIASGSIKPQEIAREAEELMREFSTNSSFVEMMGGLKSAFGFEDMNLAKKAGMESSARMNIVRDRMRKKLEKRQAANAAASTAATSTVGTSVTTTNQNNKK